MQKIDRHWSYKNKTLFPEPKRLRILGTELIREHSTHSHALKWSIFTYWSVLMTWCRSLTVFWGDFSVMWFTFKALSYKNMLLEFIFTSPFSYHWLCRQSVWKDLHGWEINGKPTERTNFVEAEWHELRKYVTSQYIDYKNHLIL